MKTTIDLKNKHNNFIFLITRVSDAVGELKYSEKQYQELSDEIYKTQSNFSELVNLLEIKFSDKIEFINKI